MDFDAMKSFFMLAKLAFIMLGALATGAVGGLIYTVFFK